MAKMKAKPRRTPDSERPKDPSSKRRRTDTALANDVTPKAPASTGNNPKELLVNEVLLAKRVKVEPVESPTKADRVDTERGVRNKTYDDIIFLKIGPEAAKFAIHRGLLTKHSSYFEKILKQGYAADSTDVAVTLEEDSKVLNLPDIHPETFARVNSWIYSQHFRIQGETWKDIEWQHLINVYLFAVQTGTAILHNTCMDATILKVQDGALFPGQGTINALWNTSINVTPLRKLFVRLFAAHCDLKSAILSNPAYHPTFLNQLVIEMYDMLSNGIKPDEVNIWKMRKQYRMHGPGNPIAIG